ncbi:MAG: hypothetical protein QOJ59_4316, partial [Thermomicrobiales bacterium]|nr:hypothetical protein [Thermomicrobiales bacterium]
MVATTDTATTSFGTRARADLIRVGPRTELSGVTVVSGGRHGIAVFASATSDRVYAVDN